MKILKRRTHKTENFVKVIKTFAAVVVYHYSIIVVKLTWPREFLRECTLHTPIVSGRSVSAVVKMRNL
jgi:hypothetical protein